MFHLLVIKNSAISMDANVSSMDDQVRCYQYGCQCVIHERSSTLLSVWMHLRHLWMIKYSAISLDINVSSLDDQVL